MHRTRVVATATLVSVLASALASVALVTVVLAVDGGHPALAPRPPTGVFLADGGNRGW